MRRLTWILSLCCLCWTHTGRCEKPAEADVSIVREITVPQPEIAIRHGEAIIELPGGQLDPHPGKPLLPVLPVTLEIPSGYSVTAIDCREATPSDESLSATVPWAQLPTGAERLPDIPADATVYGVDAFYPQTLAGEWRVDRINGKDRLSIPLFPIRWNPRRNLLRSARRITITVALAKTPEKPSAPRLLADTPSPLDSTVTNDYVILAPAALATNRTEEWNFDTLLEQRRRDGFRPAIYTTEWVAEHYPGTNLAIQVRAFAQDAHARCGLRYLLIGGTHRQIPCIPLYTQYNAIIKIYRESIPADAIYFGCLDGEFDHNGNGIYGELGDGDGGGDVDLTAEVMVGRFPVETPAEVANLVRKTILYENAPASAFDNHAFAAEEVNFGTMVYADGFMDELRFGSDKNWIDTIGYETSIYSNRFLSTTLYDSTAGNWTQNDALALLEGNFATINHLGHGRPKSCMKITISDATCRNRLLAISNDIPYFVYSGACQAGAYDVNDCFAEVLVTATNLAVGTVMSSRDSWEYTGSVGGFNHNFHRAFWDAALRGTATRFGEINEASRLANLPLISATQYTLWRWAYYEVNLFGDPALPFAKAINQTPPSFEHTPLINTYETNLPYRISCAVEPIGIYDPASVTLLWRSDTSDEIHTQLMSQVEGNLYESFIPAHPVNTRIDYQLRAVNAAGVTGYFPADGETCRFFTTEKLSLSILGSPAQYGEVTPDYGLHHSASGLPITLTAPLLVPLSDTRRMRFNGAVGGGSAPATTDLTTNRFEIAEDSFHCWRWQLQYQLAISSRPDGIVATNIWTDDGEYCEFPDIPLVYSDETGTNQVFTYWRLDGAKILSRSGRPPRTLTGQPITAAHTLVACYQPEEQDEDGNGIPDWYEYRYYGEIGNAPNGDDDADGFTLAEEYADRTDPLDATSVPAAPVIEFTPLDEEQLRPGPFTLEARLTDSCRISNASVFWNRNGGGWHETRLSCVTGDLYRAEFSSKTQPADLIEYYIQASDPAGYVATSETNLLFTVYPLADFSYLLPHTVTAYANDPTVTWTNRLVNHGNDTLTGVVSFARCDAVTDLTPTWSAESIGQPWTITTNECASAPYSLHAQLDSALGNGESVHATITFPACRIGRNARLTFLHKILAETDRNSPHRAYDAGIVEYATGTNETFRLLPGPYTHEMYGWQKSPWEDGIPCFSGIQTAEWQRVTFDLAELLPDADGLFGEDVRFRFHFGGDNNTDLEGWYIDDIAVYPLLSRPAFNTPSGPNFPFEIAAGRRKAFSWYNTPTTAPLDDDTVTILVQSNDPYTPFYAFDWRLLIAYPETFLQGVQTTGNRFGFSWQTEAGYRYTVETTTNLISAVWTPVEGAVELDGTGLPFTWSVPITNAPAQFFRLRITR
ncbi:MAG: hypothetical protein IJR99_05800 [Kiritimatiellae bacterium]|nr:hypothetical protein [Kiritimatiellia bacterium]